jgi:homoserine kinase type II
MGTPALFGPNNHSAFAIEWRTVTPEVFSSLERILKINYGFERIDAIEQVGECELTSNNFRVHGSKDGNAVTRLLRKNILQKDEGGIVLITRIMEDLSARGVRVPAVIPASDGRPFVAGDALYQLFSFIEGDHFRGTEGELNEIGRGVAELHRALRDLPCIEEIRQRKHIVPPWRTEDLNGMKRSAEERGNAIDRRVLDAWPYVQKAVQRVESGRAGLATGDAQPIHCDLHPHNTLFRDGKLAAIIDFERVEIGTRAKDVANACHRFVRQYVVNQGGPWEALLPKGAGLFLDAYEAVLPLAAEDKAMLPVVLCDELIRKVVFVESAYYTGGSERYFENGEFDKIITLLQEAHFLADIFEKR